MKPVQILNFAAVLVFGLLVGHQCSRAPAPKPAATPTGSVAVPTTTDVDPAPTLRRMGTGRSGCRTACADTLTLQCLPPQSLPFDADRLQRRAQRGHLIGAQYAAVVAAADQDEGVELALTGQDHGQFARQRRMHLVASRYRTPGAQGDGQRFIGVQD